jgi:hypothetical protein
MPETAPEEQSSSSDPAEPSKSNAASIKSKASSGKQNVRKGPPSKLKSNNDPAPSTEVTEPPVTPPPPTKKPLVMKKDAVPGKGKKADVSVANLLRQRPLASPTLTPADRFPLNEDHVAVSARGATKRRGSRATAPAFTPPLASQ